MSNETPQPPSDSEIMEAAGKEYDKAVESELNEQKKKEDEDTARRFDEIRGLGFAIKSDIEATQNDILKQIKEIKEEWRRVKELSLRRTAQGKSIIPPSQKKSEKDELKDIYGELPL